MVRSVKVNFYEHFIEVKTFMVFACSKFTVIDFCILWSFEHCVHFALSKTRLYQLGPAPPPRCKRQRNFNRSRTHDPNQTMGPAPFKMGTLSLHNPKASPTLCQSPRRPVQGKHLPPTQGSNNPKIVSFRSCVIRL